MGIADRHTARFRHESDRIQKQPKQGGDDDELSFEDFDTATPAVPAKLPGDSVRSRTATRHDPLTTELLAEVSRRSQTLDVSPDMVEEAQQQADDAEPAPVPVAANRKR